MPFARSFRWIVLLALAHVWNAAGEEPRPDPSAALPDSVQIRNVQSGLLLRPRDANNADGTPLVLYPAQPWRCMTWTVGASAPGSLLATLKNRFTAKTFGAGEDHVVKQTPFRADGLWRFEKLADGTWRILNPADGRALSAHGEGIVALDEWKDLPGQRWEVLPAPARLTM